MMTVYLIKGYKTTDKNSGWFEKKAFFNIEEAKAYLDARYDKTVIGGEKWYSPTESVMYEPVAAYVDTGGDAVECCHDEETTSVAPTSVAPTSLSETIEWEHDLELEPVVPEDLHSLSLPHETPTPVAIDSVSPPPPPRYSDEAWLKYKTDEIKKALKSPTDEYAATLQAVLGKCLDELYALADFYVETAFSSAAETHKYQKTQPTLSVVNNQDAAVVNNQDAAVVNNQDTTGVWYRLHDGPDDSNFNDTNPDDAVRDNYKDVYLANDNELPTYSITPDTSPQGLTIVTNTPTYDNVTVTGTKTQYETTISKPGLLSDYMTSYNERTVAETPNPKKQQLKVNLINVLNSLSIDSDTNTPDYVLANYLMGCLESFEYAMKQRNVWLRSSVDELVSSARGDYVDADIPSLPGDTEDCVSS